MVGLRPAADFNGWQYRIQNFVHSTTSHMMKAIPRNFPLFRSHGQCPRQQRNILFVDHPVITFLLTETPGLIMSSVYPDASTIPS